MSQYRGVGNRHGGHLPARPTRRVAVEVARKNQLAKGEDGLKELKAAPTLAQFAENAFLQFIEKHKENKPRTVVFYQTPLET